MPRQTKRHNKLTGLLITLFHLSAERHGSIALVKVTLCMLLLVPIAAFGQSYLDQFPFQQQSTYFDFRFKRNPEHIKAIAHFADAFIGTVNRDFFKADFDYPIRVLVVEDSAALQKILRDRFDINVAPHFGIFLYRYNLFITYEDSGLGTFAHEIMHPLVERNLKDRPIWAIEGIPTFFEKFYGYWQDDKLVINWGYQNPWRIEMLGTNLTLLDLKAIVTTAQTPGDYRESDRRLVAMFLWEQGKFKRFLDLIKSGERNGYKSYFEAAMDLPLDKIIPLWAEYINTISKKRDEIMRLPPSTILDDKTSFEKFSTKYRIPLIRQ